MTTTLSIEEKIELCQVQIGYRFNDLQLLQNALTHASGAARRLESNERLEFLGDSILGMIVCQYLYQNFPDLLEGEMTKIKSNVVSRRICARIAKRLGLEPCLIIGRGMLHGLIPRSLFSDVFESLIAAIYLDGGFESAKDFIETALKEELVVANEECSSGNFKSVLQHKGQREFGLTPRYKLVRQAGPDHDKTFAVSAELGERVFSPGLGKNKKDAEQRAAANALAELRGDVAPFDNPIQS